MTYDGAYWHDPTILNPNLRTKMYTCVNDGCPDKGESAMQCKLGFTGPLCAVCQQGYFKSVRDCTPCEHPRFAPIFGLVIGISLVAGAVKFWVQKYQRYLHRAAAFSHLKVVISFMTLLVTLGSQFGVVWPDSFAKALNAMSVLSFDFSIMSGLFCIVNMRFYDNLLSTTMLLAIAVIGVLVRSYVLLRRATDEQRAKEIWQEAIFVAMYILLFAYPVVSVKVVEAFACHEVEGVRYLRADYSARCDTSEWFVYAVYSTFWIACYVVAFPAFVLWKLYTYRRNPKDPGHTLGFLADDFKTTMPALLWEGVEMIRKLLLSVIGAFWSSQSTMCIATALLISSVFLALHLCFQPYKSPMLNRMQTLALAVITLFYFNGLLLKTESVEESDREDLGALMVALMVSIFTAAIAVVASEVKAIIQWVRPIWHAFSILYEGCIQERSGVPCISSFPGKFEQEWNEVTRIGSSTRAEVSVACVFLPMHTPDFGQHVDNAETPGKCYCYSLYGEQKMWGCKWFDVWKGLVQLAHYRKQRIQVFFFPGQVGEGKIRWEDCAEKALLRDEVMAAWPKDDAGWPKRMSTEEEAAYAAGLPAEERHCIVGLGGSQKAEVAWLDAHEIPYEQLDVGRFSLDYLKLFQADTTVPSRHQLDYFKNKLVSASAASLDKGVTRTIHTKKKKSRERLAPRNTWHGKQGQNIQPASQHSAEGMVKARLFDRVDRREMEMDAAAGTVDAMLNPMHVKQPHVEQQQKVSNGASAGANTTSGVRSDARSKSVAEALDPSTGQPYYYNQFTKKTGWSAEGVSRKGAVDVATSSVGTELVDSIVVDSIVVDEDSEDEDEGGARGELPTVPTPWKRSGESTGLKSIQSQASV
jgi:hypothetical protein